MPATTYKSTYPALFLEICESGGSICDFCRKVKVVRSTFYEWVGAHEEFKEAWQLGKEITESILTQKGLDGMETPGFNSTVWSILMRNKCSYVEHRKVAIDFTGCKTMNEKMAVLNQRVAEGRLTPKEAKDFADYIATATKIDEATDGKVRLEQVEEALGIKK